MKDAASSEVLSTTIEHSVVGRDEDLDDMLSAQIVRRTYPIMDVVRGL